MRSCNRLLSRRVQNLKKFNEKKYSAHIIVNAPWCVEVSNVILCDSCHNFHSEEHAGKQMDTERGYSKKSQHFEHSRSNVHNNIVLNSPAHVY